MGWNIQLPTAEYYLPDDPRLEGIVREVEDLKEIAIDTETDGLTLWKCIPYYWSLSWENDGKSRRLCMPASTLPRFKRAFEDYTKRWIFANAKFDAHMLANVGITIAGQLVDTQVMHALLYEEKPHGLKDMALQILNWKWTDFSDTFGSLRKGICLCSHTLASHKAGYCSKTGCQCPTFRQSTPIDVLRRAETKNIDLLIEYAANDAYGTMKIYQALLQRLEKEKTWSAYPDRPPFINTMADLFFKVEVPFTKVLYYCERNGMRIDRAYLEGIAPKIEKEIAGIEIEANRLAGRRINPSSNPQLREYFFGELKLTPLRHSSGGNTGISTPSVDETFLEHYAPTVPMAAVLLRHRKLTKQFGTYVEGMLESLDPNDRVHARFNQDVARTGRLSSSNPNLQNITGGEKDEFRIRYAFIPKGGHTLIVSDYEQLEMRLLACASKEQKLVDIFLSGKDIHTGNCELVFGIPYEKIVEARNIDKKVKKGQLPEEAMTAEVKAALKARHDIKTIGFGLNYGMKEKKLSRDIGCSVEEAAALIERYMDTYPAVRQFYKDAIDETCESLFAFTFLGRRRYLPDINANNEMDRWRAERQAVNLPIQGTAADVAKMAMILCYEDQLESKYGCRMLSQVHDELIFECPKETAAEVMPIIKEWMEHPFPTELAVPLTADIGEGPSWGAAK